MKKHFIFYILVLLVQVTFSQPREERYPNGKLKLLENYKNGMQHGLSTYYHENGIKSKEGNYENGKEIGNWKLWYKDGKLKSEENYYLGRKYGAFTNYYDSGILALKIILKTIYLIAPGFFILKMEKLNLKKIINWAENMVNGFIMEKVETKFLKELLLKIFWKGNLILGIRMVIKPAKEVF